MDGTEKSSNEPSAGDRLLDMDDNSSSSEEDYSDDVMGTDEVGAFGGTDETTNSRISSLDGKEYGKIWEAGALRKRQEEEEENEEEEEENEEEEEESHMRNGQSQFGASANHSHNGGVFVLSDGHRLRDESDDDVLETGLRDESDDDVLDLEIRSSGRDSGEGETSKISLTSPRQYLPGGKNTRTDENFEIEFRESVSVEIHRQHSSPSSGDASSPVKVKPPPRRKSPAKPAPTPPKLETAPTPKLELEPDFVPPRTHRRKHGEKTKMLNDGEGDSAEKSTLSNESDVRNQNRSKLSGESDGKKVQNRLSSSSFHSDEGEGLERTSELDRPSERDRPSEQNHRVEKESASQRNSEKPSASRHTSVKPSTSQEKPSTSRTRLESSSPSEDTDPKPHSGNNSDSATLNHSDGDVSPQRESTGDNGTLPNGSQTLEPFTTLVDAQQISSEQKLWDQKLDDVSTAVLSNIFRGPHDTVNNKQLKKLLRSGTWHPGAAMRNKAWQWLCVHQLGKLESSAFYTSGIKEMYPDTGEEQIQPPTWPQAPANDLVIHPTYHLTPKGKATANKIVCFLQHSCPDISYGPTFLAMADLFLHYMSEEECYSLLETLRRSKGLQFLIQTRKLSDVSKLVLRDLAKKHCKRAFSDVSRSCSIEAVCSHWLQWIYDLPFNYVVAITDCYLNEGIKVLYRVAMAIMILFAKAYHLHNNTMPHIETKIAQFCQKPPFSPAQLLKVAFKIRNFSRERMFKLTQRHTSSVYDSPRSGIPSVPSRQSLGTGGNSVALSAATVAIFRKAGSQMISPEQFHSVWEWLPQKQKIMRPRLIFSSYDHGTSLITLYKKLDEDEYPHKETIFLIKAISGEIFGAFCASWWAERQLKENLDGRYFGLGQTFVFSIEPQRVKFPWVGTAKEEGVCVNQHDIPMSASMFQSGDNNNMMIGGGGSGNAIYFDSTFRFCRSARCDTFDNPPLVKNEDFEASGIEVFGFVEE